MQLLALFAFLWVGALLPSASGQDNCALHGKDGVKGVNGRDGLPGAKGEKGVSALQDKLNSINVEELKGEMGSRGPPGEFGLKGFIGEQGPNGPPGPKGPSGSSASIGNVDGNAGSQKPAFSVLRNRTDYASYGQPVTFDSEFSNVNDHFKRDTGYFTCKVPGVYYFVFHASSEGRLCLRLKSDSQSPVSLSFCDYNPRSQSLVVSGGVVLKLSKNNKVWIEPFTDGGDRTMSKSMYVVFNGFLIDHITEQA
ncbi:complement C1q subcomponent subunit A [Pseudorasbora parva]|uniref:complement C1q subcomponent subunit A n=1 Tax=Pseudorasbora parva TaxID=51549 RepID=UPI00351E6349